MVHYDLAIDQHEIDAVWSDIGMLVGGAILDFVVVEDDDVGPQAFTNQAAVGDAHARGRPRSHLADGVLEGQRVLLANVTRDYAGEISVAARMRETERVIAAGRQSRSGVAADAGPGKLESRLNVLLAHHMVNR
jgi:hypothetical protein